MVLDVAGHQRRVMLFGDCSYMAFVTISACGVVFEIQITQVEEGRSQ
jgi:hypothetical protein